MPRSLLTLLALSIGCGTCPRPSPVLVVPSADSHCLTQPPPAIAAVVEDLAKLPAGQPGTRAELDQLAAGYVDAVSYARRAFELCGTKPQAGRTP